MSVRFGSVCSGIEAASVAWHPLGWKAAWFAEIEAFPSAVLAHHYPEVPNLGDMTTLPDRILGGEVEAPDVFCGGTPCQAFSVAGLRRSLDDARGNLSLTFCEIADAIDDVRRARRDDPCIVFWENVPGVLSTSDNAFGCFVGAIAGCDSAIVSALGWPDAGVVSGPKRAVAWRVLDAQFFGLAQRRRRVFVVASARDGFDPAAVLFEFDGLRRDTAPSREAGQGAAAGTLRSTDGGSDVDHARARHIVGPLTAACGPNGHGGSGLATDKGAEAGHILAFGGNRTSGPIEVSPALLAQPGSGWKGDFESETFIAQAPIGVQASQSGVRLNETIGTLDANYGSRRHNGVMVPAAHAFDARQSDILQYGDKTGPLDTDGHTIGVLAFDTTQVTSATNRSNPKPGDPCHPLAAGAHAPAIAFSSKDHGADATADLAPTLRAMGHDGSHANGGGQMAVAFDTYNQTVTGDTAQTLCSRGDSPGGNAHLVPAIQSAMQVRRLTPRECERLQGFPDDYTAIPWRGKPASECPDGPRYKALGNSWAVPVVRWIGERIDRALLEATA